MKHLNNVGLILLVLLLGAGWAMAQPEDNPVELTKDSFELYSQDGNFTVTWPAGCGELHTRTSQPDAEATAEDSLPVEVVNVFCDRNGNKGQGCSVTVIFNELDADGHPPGPAQVIERIERTLTAFGVQIVKQTPISKEFPDGSVIQGLDLLAGKPDDPGEVWLRGLLFAGNIYLLAAWDENRKIADSPEYLTFFNTFHPGQR